MREAENRIFKSESVTDACSELIRIKVTFTGLTGSISSKAGFGNWLIVVMLEVASSREKWILILRTHEEKVGMMQNLLCVFTEHLCLRNNF